VRSQKDILVVLAELHIRTERMMQLNRQLCTMRLSGKKKIQLFSTIRATVEPSHIATAIDCFHALELYINLIVR